MLQRLYASLVKGPSLNARPHHSRQRVDLSEIDAFRGLKAASLVDSLLGEERAVECPAKVSRFEPPKTPERAWTPEQKQAQRDYAAQVRLLNKFHDIALDGRDYLNDHGEDALFVAYPMLSVPAIQDSNLPSSPRVLAPLAFVPVSLTVHRHSKLGIKLKATGEGADLLIPNPALLAWVEQQTGKEIDDLFGDDTGEDPWKELREILGCVTSAMGIRDSIIAPRLPIEPIPKIPDLPAKPTILPCAVLGLFPTTNPGLMRDTKWMMANEAQLQAPVSLFLNRQVLELRDHEIERPEEDSRPVEESERFEAEALVTRADPCQAEAVAHARKDQAVVVHGPPGTGKSQTIANIIGDHVARQQRVLFVCDKRTALDVVKYRLDALGLGELCGVIHDVQRDRRSLYLGIRERLEAMADEERPRSPLKRLDNVNGKLEALRVELQGYYDSLHASEEDRHSFHDLVGQWMRLQMATPKKGGDLVPDLMAASSWDEASIETFLADIDECLQHASSAELGSNPYHGRLALSLSEFMSGHIDDLSANLDRVLVDAEALDQSLEQGPLKLDPDSSMEDQRRSLERVLEASEASLQEWVDGVALRIATLSETVFQDKTEEATQLNQALDTVSEAVERELELVCPLGSLGLNELKTAVKALGSYRGMAESWTRVFAFGKKRAAEAAIAPLGLGLDVASIDRATQYFKQMEAAILLDDWLERLSGTELANEGTRSFESLRSEARSTWKAMRWRQEAARSPLRGELAPLLPTAAESKETLRGLMGRLQHTLERIGLLQEYTEHLGQLKLWTPEAIDEETRQAYALEEVAPRVRRWQACQDSLEDVLRFERRLPDLPEGLQRGLVTLALAEVETSDGVGLLRRVAVEQEIKQRLRTGTELLDITTERVEAALKEFGQRVSQKETLVRELALYHWRGRQHDRLMAGSGSRLNSLGASLRQRLFIRGKRALKLRQMIQAGQDIPDGDPLFDLCPVWMASPSTVSQIFSRDALFDVIIFDEASQCRLEEALPVLLRGKRVVIAGDPKQLPPTRFFESAVGDSEFADAESLEELAAQQLSETEDLLGAALNLDLQSCYLDVHYRSRSEALIGFSNEAFYQHRLQPIPGHPQRRPEHAPLRVYRVDGVYRDRSNPDEAEKVVSLVEELLGAKEPPSIGIACFNLNQRDVIVDALEKRAAEDATFSERLEQARNRQGEGSFEGLFVKNLENVQGDERDHIIISTTFGPASDGKFRRNFGALSRHGGERRLNVLVTRARERIHVLTSIPRTEYVGGDQGEEPVTMTGRQYLYQFLHYAEQSESAHAAATAAGGKGEDGKRTVYSDPRGSASESVQALARRLDETDVWGVTSHWGNEGFCVDVAINEPDLADAVTLGVLLDFNRYRKTPDPVKWEHFRSEILRGQGWDLKRIWSPDLFRKGADVVTDLERAHQQRSSRSGTSA